MKHSTLFFNITKKYIVSNGSGSRTMKIQTECVPCLLKRILFEAELSSKDKKLQAKVMKNACTVMAQLYDPEVCSTYIATQVHKIAYETLGDNDPYASLKQTSNTVALSLIPQVETLIKKSKDPLKTSMICSIIGNTMDFGIEGGSVHPTQLSTVFNKLYKDGLGHDDNPQVQKILQSARHIVFFTDNCGEIVFDKILCRELKRYYPSLHLTLVVKGTPILSDATMEDVNALKMQEVVDEVMTTGCFAVGMNIPRLPAPVKNALRKADLIICKGMANYESFSETSYRPVVYLLRTKCTAIARSMGLPLQINAIKLFQ